MPTSLPSPAATPPALPFLLLGLTGCFGLDAVPDREKDRGGRDLDTATPIDDTGAPLDSAEDLNRAPVADAGPDAEASVGVVVTLDGSGSWDPDDHALTYDWRFLSVPGASSVVLVDADRADPQFIPDVPGRYELGLVVDDGGLASEEDTVEITAMVQNGAPVANAGRDQRVPVGTTVTLDGSASADPDGDVLQYAWTLVSRPPGSTATLSSSTTASPIFLADLAGTYELSLTVSDGAETSTPDTVRVIAEQEDTGGGDSDCGCRSTDPRRALGTALLVALAGLVHRRSRR